MMSLRHVLAATAVLASTGLLVGACATEDYVNQQVGALKSELSGQVAALNGRVDQNAGQIQALNGGVQDARRAAQDASAQVAEHKSAQGIAPRVISTDDSTTFETAKWDLSSEDQTSLSAFAQKLLSANQDVYLEIEGHADSRGNTAANNALGMKRAVATRDFLAQQGIPLHRMSVVSYGEIKPTASNDTAEGQAANRRATIVVVAP
jgi:outer membrane protein OmpA-like peptidoglycan-associated protein